MGGMPLPGPGIQYNRQIMNNVAPNPNPHPSQLGGNPQ